MAAHCDDGKGKRKKNESDETLREMRHAFIDTQPTHTATINRSQRTLAFIGATVGVTSRESDASHDGAQ